MTFASMSCAAWPYLPSLTSCRTCGKRGLRFGVHRVVRSACPERPLVELQPLLYWVAKHHARPKRPLPTGSACSHCTAGSRTRADSFDRQRLEPLLLSRGNFLRRRARSGTTG
jgi:hypothetical protein